MNKIDKKSLDYVLYARKSTEDANKQIQSIEDQVRMMKAKAKTERLLCSCCSY